MSRSEEPYFEKLFACLAKHINPKLVLEIGFGLGISAGFIQRFLRPSSHYIVEIDESIGADLIQFSSSHVSVKPIIGDWMTCQFNATFDFIFYDPFDYIEKTEQQSQNEMQQLHRLVGKSGVLCHPHFGDGEPRQLVGFRNVILERFDVPRITMADGTYCEKCAVILCYSTT